MFVQACFPTALETQRPLMPGMTAEFHFTQVKKEVGAPFYLEASTSVSRRVIIGLVGFCVVKHSLPQLLHPAEK